jgi:hypothetical protein
MAKNSISQVFAWPLVLAIASLIGLLSALIGDAAWDSVSWAMLGAPVLVIAWYGFRRVR